MKSCPICPLGWQRTSEWQKWIANASQTKRDIVKKERGISALYSLGSFVGNILCYKFEKRNWTPHLFWSFQALNIRFSVLKVSLMNDQAWTFFVMVLLPCSAYVHVPALSVRVSVIVVTGGKGGRERAILLVLLCVETHVFDMLRTVTVKCRLIVFL